MSTFFLELTVGTDLYLNLNVLFLQVAVLPFGKLMAYALPTTRFNTFGYTWSLNPGPFNVKEHTVITAMGIMTWTTPFVLSTYIVQEVNYGQELSYSYRIMNNLSSQLIGVGFAGLFYRFLVHPASMIYPGTLVSCSLMNTLHRTWRIREKGHLSRERLFLFVILGGIAWYFVPGFLFTGLSFFSWVCWIAPTNSTVNTVFGSVTGMGMGLLTFDWNQIAQITNPLVSPVRHPSKSLQSVADSRFVSSGGLRSISMAASSSLVGLLPRYCTVSTSLPRFAFAAHFSLVTNTWYAKYLPYSSTVAWDNTGMPYNLPAVIVNGTFDVTAYEAYSPLFLSVANVLTFSICFAIFPAAVVHTCSKPNCPVWPVLNSRHPQFGTDATSCASSAQISRTTTTFTPG